MPTRRVQPAILEVIEKRTSIRAFEPEAVQDADLHGLLEAARWAPSWGNLQPWRLVVVRSETTRAALGDSFTEGNRWARRAPMLIVVAANPGDAKQRAGESSYAFDCGLATECLLLEAARRGLAAHPMGGWDEAMVRKSIGVPETMRIVVVIAVGKPGNADDLDEGSREKDSRPRERRPLESIAFGESWGRPLLFLHEDSRDD